MSVMRVRLARDAALRGTIFKEFVELVRAAADRALLPVVRTQRGAPRVAAGPHLGPNHTSVCEFVDFELADPITGTAFHGRLAEALPPGLRVVWVGRPPLGAKSLKAGITAFRYRVDGAFAPDKAERFLQSDQWPLRRIRKGRERVLDLRRSVSKLEVRPGEVIMDIEVRAEGAPKPEEAMASVFVMPWEDALLLPMERSGVRFAGPSTPRT
jgi:radical SAM-linked protein